MFDSSGFNAQLRTARVGKHVYLLRFDRTTDKSGAVIGRQRILHAPLAAPLQAADLKTVLDEPAAKYLTVSLLESGVHVLAVRRPADGPQPSGTTAVAHELVAAAPAADGKLAFAKTGLSIDLKLGDNARVTGSRHGCLARMVGKDIALHCHTKAATGWKAQSHPLKLPDVARNYLGLKLSTGQPLGYTAPSRLAVSDKWIVVATRELCGATPLWLHVAGFNRAANKIMGPWTSTETLTWWPDECRPTPPVWLRGDTLYLHGMTTRLAAGKPGLWRVATVLPSAPLYLQDWTDAGDVLLAAFKRTTTGVTTTEAVLVNRVLW